MQETLPGQLRHEPSFKKLREGEAAPKQRLDIRNPDADRTLRSEQLSSPGTLVYAHMLLI